MADYTESRNEQILRATIDDEPYTAEPQSRIEELLIELKETIEHGGGGGGDIDVDTEISDSSRNPVENRAIAAVLAEKADAADLVDFVTEAVVNDMIASSIGGITTFEYYLCEQGEYDPSTGEPTVANPDTSHIYLTPTSGDNLYMYAYINNDFVFLGTTEIDLEGYATTADVTAAVSGKADANHNHDDRYYTESEVDAALANKADANHNHDDSYYTEGEVDSALSAKANASHTHDDRYYTETEVDTALSGKADSNHNHDSRYYTESEMDTKLNGKSNTGHTHAYSEITGTPTIPTVPSNITLGKKGGTNTQLTINVIDSGTPASGTPDTTITIVKG